MRVLIYCEAGTHVGLGHIMRSVALGATARRRGWTVDLVGRFTETALDSANPRRYGIGIIRVESDPVASIKQLVRSWRPDVVHLDTYNHELDDFGGGRYLLSNMQGGRHGARPADLAIDANLGVELRSPELRLSNTIRTGVEYALIREDVRVLRGEWRGTHPIPRVLVVLGGSDPFQYSTRAAEMLGSLRRPMEFTFLCPKNQHRKISEILEPTPHSVSIRSFDPDMARLAIEHDVVITASGTSLWDFSCMGVPVAAVCVTENQERSYAAMVDKNLAFPLGDLYPSCEVSRTFETFVCSPDALIKVSAQLSKLVDGRGTDRVVDCWDELATPRL